MEYKYIEKCAVCGLEYDADANDDICPRCGWLCGCDFGEDDEPNDANHGMTLNQAKELYAKGLTKFGDPIDYEEN